MIESTALATIFVCAIEEHALGAQYKGWQERKIHFYWQTKLTRHLYLFHASLTRAWRWGEVECTSEKSPISYGYKDVLHLNKKKKETEAAVVRPTLALPLRWLR